MTTRKPHARTLIGAPPQVSISPQTFRFNVWRHLPQLVSLTAVARREGPGLWRLGPLCVSAKGCRRVAPVLDGPFRLADQFLSGLSSARGPGAAGRVSVPAPGSAPGFAVASVNAQSSVAPAAPCRHPCFLVRRFRRRGGWLGFPRILRADGHSVIAEHRYRWRVWHEVRSRIRRSAGLPVASLALPGCGVRSRRTILAKLLTCMLVTWSLA